MVRHWFTLWDRTGQSASVLLGILAIFNYDDLLLSDFARCLEFLDYLKRWRAAQDIFGLQNMPHA